MAHALEVFPSISCDGCSDGALPAKPRSFRGCLVLVPLFHEDPEVCPGADEGRIGVTAKWLGSRVKDRGSQINALI